MFFIVYRNMTQLYGKPGGVWRQAAIRRIPDGEAAGRLLIGDRIGVS
ncbi:MAG TPA: hypothetical protein VFE19_09730 [Jatrophihabitantaceae bacterium]|jgi:hypothetical protein|nr:hypothetical protein [Jatrophihabitantaceae bacterium]